MLLSKIVHIRRRLVASGRLFALVLPCFTAVCLPAQVGGTLSGAITDPAGIPVAGAAVSLDEATQHRRYTSTSDGNGLYSFPHVTVGTYALTVSAPGFALQTFSDVRVDAASAQRLNVALRVGGVPQTINVSAEDQATVELAQTSLGEVISQSKVTALPLNGRSYTDLLALTPGVVPATSLLPSSVIMAGVTGAIAPSGDLNPGNVSISGQRESSNGFLVNGIDVQEHMNGGTALIPDLESIDEFKVLTSNFEAEYGNYNGGMVTVVSRHGDPSFHGHAFEFLRNTVLDARGYFDAVRPVYRQNQYGGTLGGPVPHTAMFFFTDFQQTSTTQGISTPQISVPTELERVGNFTDPITGANTLTGNVSGSYFASLLSAKLGRTVRDGDAYRKVFPDGVIPLTAWSKPAAHLIDYIPRPNVNASTFSTSAFAQTVRDSKGSVRLDRSGTAGEFALYAFVDDYRLDNPYPGTVAGASIPGFDALTLGRAQLWSVSHTLAIGARTVHEFHAGYLRNANIIGQPRGGAGVTLSSQGFVTGANTSGIDVQAPQFEGVANITFPSFVMGVPVTNSQQVNNTFYVSEGISRAAGAHLLKFGVQLHADQVNEHPNGTFNGTFNLSGTETGSSFADFLLGVASNFTQSTGPPFYLRNRYLGAYAQDSWRVSSELTVNAGLRWDIIVPWWEKYDRLQTYVPGLQSVFYPGAPTGMVVPGDPGIPRTIAPVHYGNVAPRLGIAYALRGNKAWTHALFGEQGSSSLRASYGLFYTAFPGLNAGIMYAVPPFGYNYLSPDPPLMETPFISASTGVNNGQRFPFPLPPTGVSAQNPDRGVDWSKLVPISADPFFSIGNRPSYISNYILSYERSLLSLGKLTVSYVGNQGHRLLVLRSVNPGNPQLCLSLPGCGPFAEDATYVAANGSLLKGTRVGQGASYGENTSDESTANSNYNALQTSLRVAGHSGEVVVSYTYGKSIDQGSNLGEQLNYADPRASRTISAFDIRHDFISSYSVELPLEHLFRRANAWLCGWNLSGAVRLASGFPVTLSDDTDNSLRGTLGNGANNLLLDTPQFTPGPLHLNRDPRKGAAAFNTALFAVEPLGQLGSARRRMFYGPGIENVDTALRKSVTLGKERSLEFRMETFNTFNHAQFFGPASVNGRDTDVKNFGAIVSAAAPRLMQAALKLSF